MTRSGKLISDPGRFREIVYADRSFFLDNVHVYISGGRVMRWEVKQEYRRFGRRPYQDSISLTDSDSGACISISVDANSAAPAKKQPRKRKVR